jgi:hypothetical protein
MASPSGNSPAIASNVFIPTFDGELQVGFSRNVKQFKLPQYAKYTDTKKIAGYYLKWSPNAASRVMDVNRFHWPENSPRPNNADPSQFRAIPFATKRYSYDWRLGDLTIEQAEMQLVQAEREATASRCMTARTMRSITALTTTSNWATSGDEDMAANHYNTTSSAGMGDISAGSSTDPRIKQAINHAFIKIAIDTNGVLSSQPAKYFAICNPNDADRISRSQEYVDYLKGSPAAAAEVEGNRHPNNKYGLPSELYGVEWIIEDTVKTTSEIKGTLARSFVWPDATLAIVTRVGALDGVFGGKDFSTFQMFYQEEMTTEEFPDKENRLTRGTVTENVKEILTCPASGFLFTSIFTD